MNDVQLPCRVIDPTSGERPLVVNVAPSLLVVSVLDDKRKVRAVWVDVCALNLSSDSAAARRAARPAADKQSRDENRKNVNQCFHWCVDVETELSHRWRRRALLSLHTS